MIDELATPGAGDQAYWEWEAVLQQWENDDQLQPNLTDAQVAEVEDYMARVAERYEDWGFPPPALVPVVETDDGHKAYEIYIFDWPSLQKEDEYKTPEGVADTTTNCPTDPELKTVNIMRLNSSHELFFSDGKITAKGYQDLAHELFHAVQNNSKLSRDMCMRFGSGKNELGSWFSEGSAEAVGVDTARLLRGQNQYSKSGARWGLRGYYRDLQGIEHSDGYQTQGLWRYLAEAKHTLKTTGDFRPSAAMSKTGYETDYSYLAEFMGQGWPADEQPGRKGELKWFDAASKKVFGQGGEVMFRHFIPTFAAYPLEREASDDPAAAEAAWLEFLFGSCREHVLTEANPSSVALIRHQRISAKCIRVRADLPDHVDITISQQADGAAAGQYFRALSVGRSGGLQVGLANVNNWSWEDGAGTAQQSSMADWKFRIPGGQSHVFLITNAARGLWPTETYEGRFVIEMASWDSTMTKPTPTKSAGSESKSGSSSPDSAGFKAIDEAATEIEKSLPALSNHVSSVMSVGRDTNYEEWCSEGLAAVNICGYSLDIALMLAPGAVADTTAVTGSGGAMSQFFNSLQAIGQAGPAQVSAGWHAGVERALNQRGSYIALRTELVPYGFTGTLTNAHIRVNRGDGMTYNVIESVEPETQVVDGSELNVPSGIVTIEEYTPYVLRGTFSGTLVDPTAWNGQGPIPVVGPISGRFNVLQPWRGDRTAKLDLEHWDSADIQLAVPGMSGIIQGTLGQQGNPAAGNSGGSQQPGSGAGDDTSSNPMVGDCDCSCETVSELSNECKMPCMQHILQCIKEAARNMREGV